MVEHESQVNPDEEREQILQQTLEKMFSLMRQVHRDVSPREFPLSPPQARLVFAISRCKDDGISVKDLARIANITPGAITQFTDVLVTKNLVIREEDPRDRRMVRLKLTSSARSQLEKSRKDFLTSASRKLNALTIDELRQLNNLLAKVSSEPAGLNSDQPACQPAP
jgi:DNA-binding MarR family transcriptional regulator